MGLDRKSLRLQHSFKNASAGPGECLGGNTVVDSEGQQAQLLVNYVP